MPILRSPPLSPRSESGRKMVRQQFFALVVSIILILSLKEVGAFVLPTITSRLTSTSPLSYGPSNDSAGEIDPLSSVKKKITDYVNKELDPMCEVKDEDCRTMASLDQATTTSKNPLVFNPNVNEDPLCSPEDVDCQAFLGETDNDAHLMNSNIAEELAKRSNVLAQDTINDNWERAYCPTTFVSVSKSDWVRRVHMETYPIAVCGSAQGSLYIMNLEEQHVIAKVEQAHSIQVSENHQQVWLRKKAMESLYGKLDGGGVLSVQMHGDIIASSGREGGVKLWKIVKYDKKGNAMSDVNLSNIGEDEGELTKLISLGSLHDLQKTIVTSLKFDSEGKLWVACYDGTVRAYNVRDPKFSLGRKPVFQSDFTDSVLDIDLCEDLSLGVAATADGGAALFDLTTGQFFAGIMLVDNSAVRSVLILKHASDAGPAYSVMAGGADGTIHRLPLNINTHTVLVDQENPYAVSDTDHTAVSPKHVGPVMSMTSPSPGRFVSGGQDGALRIWQCSEQVEADKVKQPKVKLLTNCNYALTGYKLW